MAASSWKRIAKRCADIFSLVRKRNPELIVNKYCTESTSSGLLDGVKILDLSRVLAGPFCTMILGDLGADIIKVERPKVGDDTRGWGPPFAQSESVYFLSVNRNKRSITVNTKSVEGAEVIKQLACKSDVLVENFLPGKLAESGLGYDQLKEVAPHLIYCSLTGYGQTGPYRELGGYDVIAAGMGGLIHITGPEDGAPCRVGVAMTDLSTGLYAYGSIMAALLKRQKTGQGQHIDCNLLSTQVSILTHIGANYLTAGQEAKRYGTAHGSIVPYQAFPCADGHLIVGCGNDNHFKQLCKKMELDDLPTNPDYESNENRVRNRKSLLDILFKRFAEKTKTEWISIFEGSTFPHGPINNMEQVFCDPQVLHNGMVQEIEHSTVGPIKVPGPAVKYSGSELKLRYPPPTLGQHTDEVLRDVLGYSTETIERLRRDKVI